MLIEYDGRIDDIKSVSRLYRHITESAKTDTCKAMGPFYRGMKAGVQMCLWHLKWETRLIHQRKKRGFHLVWVSDEEYKRLNGEVSREVGEYVKTE